MAVNSVGSVNDPGTKGVHQITIEQITNGATSTNQFDDPGAGKQFIVFKVIVQNTGTADITVGSFKLRASDDFEYDPTFAAGLGDELSPLQSLTPGAKTQGVVIFAINQGTSPKFLDYDPNIFAKGDLYFDVIPTP